VTADLSWVLESVATKTDVAGASVFIGGSSARGWANPSSDIDVYVLGGTTDRDRMIPAAQSPDRPAIDVHGLSTVAVEDLFARVDWKAVSSGDFVNTINEKEWLLLERIHHAYVLQGHDTIADYRKRLADSAHRHMLIQYHFAQADAFAEDCLGQLEVADLDSATISGQAAYLKAVDGSIAASGCYAWSPKWRARAMQEAGQSHVSYESYWRVQTMAELPLIGQGEFALKCVGRARELISRVDIFC
jgi:predicted nucleotidyltransferase